MPPLLKKWVYCEVYVVVRWTLMHFLFLVLNECRRTDVTLSRYWRFNLSYFDTSSDLGAKPFLTSVFSSYLFLGQHLYFFRKKWIYIQFWVGKIFTKSTFFIPQINVETLLILGHCLWEMTHHWVQCVKLISSKLGSESWTKCSLRKHKASQAWNWSFRNWALIAWVAHLEQPERYLRLRFFLEAEELLQL